MTSEASSQTVIHCAVQVERHLGDLAGGNQRADCDVARRKVRAQPHVAEQVVARDDGRDCHDTSVARGQAGPRPEPLIEGLVFISLERRPNGRDIILGAGGAWPATGATVMAKARAAIDS
jgi:hypothetical protein